ncbi:LPS export ABC transporter ATP-binding protein [Zavarzinella formosa]|uniref:LPS export ABC transporter ATP-binding protein n=1 Tax=Zavarzinella formosa TaxID=360055 RepID=UPI0003020997|nr:LPS export ABC transporter ATP-binding protein [Zavarzinella formosa]
MALLEARGLVKIYGKRRVVDGVSFDVNPGEVVGLLGPNGAGKTTSFRMTTGQIVPNDGQVMFNNQDVTGLPMYRRARLGMGYLTQEQSIFRKLNVEQNLLAILEALPRSRSLGRRLTKAERRERTTAMLDRFQLQHVKYNPAARCSGGEKRRLEIARCLVCEPLLILLDEPFAAVDPKTTEDIRKNIRELAEQGIGILLTDHNVREVLKITDRSYLIKDGRVVTQGTPEQLIHDPIAINEYLGTTFSDNTFGRMSAPPPNPQPQPQPQPQPDVSRLLAEQEQARRWVEALKADSTYSQAIQELLQRGNVAVPPLVDALARRETELRVRSLEVLSRLLAGNILFDPFAGDDVRSKQLSALRKQLGL